MKRLLSSTALAVAAAFAAAPALAGSAADAAPAAAPASGAPASAAAAAVGEVVFAAGDARIEGSATPLVKGAAVEPGQTVVTGAGGHVHIRFVDDAFVAVRPQSRLTVQGYRYDPADPQGNRVRFVLQQGSTRLITGRAGQGNARAFRLNTPMAAIGIRGTDFVVQAESDVTRVSVQRGAVMMSPFGATCLAEASGPCTGGATRQLTAALADTVLEMRGDRPPVLVQMDALRHPMQLAAALPNEPALPQRRAADPASPDPVAERAFAITAQERAAASVQDRTAGTADRGTAPAGLSGSVAVAWGRWGERFGPMPATPPGYEVIGRNDALVLFRAAGEQALPTAGSVGSVSFSLAAAEAFGRVGRGGYEPASIHNATLNVDFANSRFQTRFDWTFNDSTRTLSARGDVGETGRLMPDRTASNVSLSGALSNGGNEAAYIFSKQMGNDLNAYGVLRWSR